MGIILSRRRIAGWKTEEDEAQRGLCCTLKGIWRRICSFPISLFSFLKGVVVFHRIKPRKTAGPLLPLQNPTTDHHPLKQPLLISNSNAGPQCQNIHVFSGQYLEQNQEYSRQTKNTKDSVTISIPSFSTHVLDSYSTSSITHTDSAVITQENAPRKDVSYAEHEQTGILYISTDQICEESGDQYLEQNQEYPSQVKNIVDSATIYIPNFSDHHALDDTVSAAIIQGNATQKNESYAEHEEPGVCISTEKKCEESSEGKKIEGKKDVAPISTNLSQADVAYLPRFRRGRSGYPPTLVAQISTNLSQADVAYLPRFRRGPSGYPPTLVIESRVVVEKPRWIRHYSSHHRILLVGEGDFSFSCSLAVAFGCASKMVATSLDSEAFLKKNYAKAPWNIGELEKRSCIVMHGIDATTIATQQLLQHKTFDRIIYNFPFAGFFKGLSRDSTLRLHRRLVSLFLKNAKEMIDENGEIHISHKTNSYHNEWKLVNMASSHGLRLIEEVEFDLSDYPGYNTKRGFGGDENFDCYPSNTFKFGLKFVGH